MAIMSLRGQCACGRNQYAVHIPEQSDKLAQVVYSNSSHSRRLQAAPLIAFLKIPISWFQSATVAFQEDETHQSIRKTFQSPYQEHLQNQFCGYCGTQISQFNSASKVYDEYIWVTVGTLDDEDLDLLEELGCLDLRSDVVKGEDAEDAVASREQSSTLFAPAQNVAHRGAPWFESIVEETTLGRVRRERGGHTSEDGASSVQWEVVEFSSNGDEALLVGKRKADDMES